MNRTPRVSAIAGAVALAMASTSATAALKLSDAFDGSYFNPDANGRGAIIDVADFGDRKVLGGGIYAYDAEGNPVWVLIAAEFNEHEFGKQNVDVLSFTGGTFGNPFTAPTSAVVGSADITVNSCGSLDIDLDMTDASGLADVTYELQPIAPSAQCVYQSEFTGCPDFATPAAGFSRACVLSGDILNQDIVLTNDTTWVLNGLVQIGGDNADSSTVTIEPGTILVGSGGSVDYLYVNPGSQIFANGTPTAPIILTSPNDGFAESTAEPAPGDLGGLVVSGNAPVNACPEAPFNCFSEFDQTQRFGGDNPDDSSGSISYFQVRYAGIDFTENAEVNSFTFQGVGRGTAVHHIQSFRGQDDGVEFFGGNVNVKYFVGTEGGDDAIDWDLGWSGKMQHALVAFGSGFGEDHGIEAANNPDNFDATPRATPILSNVTFIGDTGTGDGIRLKEGSAGQIWNTIVTNFEVSCINLTDGATYTAAGTPAAPTGVTALAGVIVNCANNFKQDGDAPYTTEAFFNAFPGNEAADPLLNGYQPAAGSPALTGGLVVPGDDFFDGTAHRGAFDGRTDWTTGWTFKPLGGE